MGIGLDTVLHLIYEFVHWIIAWTLPEVGVIEATDQGVKISGKKVRALMPGLYIRHRKLSQVYTDNVMRKVLVPEDVIATTQDQRKVRLGLALDFRVTDICTWMYHNEDAHDCLLVEAQRVVLEYVRGLTFLQILHADKNDLTKVARAQLSEAFGVEIRRLGLQTFVETSTYDLNHSGISFAAASTPPE